MPVHYDQGRANPTAKAIPSAMTHNAQGIPDSKASYAGYNVFTHPKGANAKMPMLTSEARAQLRGSSRPLRPGAVGSLVRAVMPTIPGQHTPAQAAFARGDDISGRTYMQVNPYTTAIRSKYGAGGASIGRHSWKTYLPVEQQNDAVAREKLKQEAAARESFLMREGEAEKIKRSTGAYIPKSKPTQELSALASLQKRNEEKILNLTKIQIEKDNINMKMTGPGYENNPYQQLAPMANDTMRQAKALEQRAKGAVRKPVLYNPLAKQIKAKNTYTEFTPKVVNADGEEFTTVDSTIDPSNIPPPPTSGSAIGVGLEKIGSHLIF